MNPDIASGVINNLSYTQLGTNANPFHYDAIPLMLTLPGGTMDGISDPTGGSASTRLDLVLDNSGSLTSGGAGSNTYSVTGKVMVGANNYDGTLLTANATAFGFADTITPDSGEFDMRMVVTGGLLTAAGGPYSVGQNLGLLIHQPALTITSFPNTFSFSTFDNGLFVGSSDTMLLPAPTELLATRQPMTQANRPPLVDAVNCSVNQDTGTNSVALYDGGFSHQVTDLSIPGRGFDWTFTRTYRTDVQDNGPLGHGWELNYNQRLMVVTAQNLARVQASIPGAKIGDVDAIDGDNRDALYVLNQDGSFSPPAGFYTRLAANADGTFTERTADGTVTTYRQPDAQGIATMAGMADRDGDTMRFVYNDQEQLTFVYDTLGRPIEYFYDATGHLAEVRDFSNRSIKLTYDGNGDLVAVTSPAVTGTPNGNDFALGKTERYTYSSGFADPRLNHELLTMTAPNEVADGGPPRVVLTYDTNPGSPNAGRVLTQQEGGTNLNAVSAGGTISYQYQTLGTATPGDFTSLIFQTTATDRNGNITQYQFNQLNNAGDVKQFANRGIRVGDPTFYETRFTYDKDYRLIQEILPQGNSIQNTYDSGNPDRFQQGNLLSETNSPDSARGGDQSAITTTFTYEPVYNQVRTITEPRGNDPSYVPQNGGVNTPARYTTVHTYDYQEGTNFAALGAILGISAAAAQARLAAAGVPMGLGDVNGDGRTDQIAGDMIRIEAPAVNLLAGSNEAAVEGTTTQRSVTLFTYNDFGQTTSMTDPEGNVTTYAYYPERDPNGDGVIDNPLGNATTGGYLSQSVDDAVSSPGRDSGTNPTPARIRTTYRYDQVGNTTRVIDGRGIATDFVYNQLNQVVQVVSAAAHGLYGPDPNETSPLADFRYITRIFYDYNDNVVLTQVEDRGNTSNVQGNPAADDLPTLGILLASTSTDVNAATTLNDTTQSWTTNQWAGLVVKITAGAGAGQLRTIASNTGTRLTLSTPWATVPDASSHYVIYPLLNPDPVGGPTAFQDTVTKFDILDQPVEVVQEVANGSAPEFLHTRFRYDPNGNQVLTILPEGNSTSAIYDERDLLFRSFRGLATPPPLVLLAPTDPTNYDVRGGGTCFCETYRYDLNGNVIETVNADNNDPASTAIDPTLGPGNRTRYIFDGFDRLTSVVDSVGSQSVIQYDPDGNVVRTSDFGPVGGPSPTSDGPSVLPGPVSSLGVIQSANLIKPGTNTLLSAVESFYDELSRPFQTSRVLFVNTIPTTRPPDVAEGGSDVGLGNLTPGQTQAIPGVSGVTILGRVSHRVEYDRNSRPTFTVQDDLNTARVFYDGVDRVRMTNDGALNNGYDPGTGTFHPANLAGNTVEAAYDANSNAIETRETDVAQVAGVAPEVFLTTDFYDSLDRLQRTVDNLGQTSDFRYDSRDNRVAMADAQGPLNGTSITRRAFPDGPRTVDAINGFGNVTRYTYDGINRQTRSEQILTPLPTITPATASGDGVHIGASIFGIKNDPTAPESFTPTPDPNQGGGDGIIRTGWNWDKNSLLSSTIDDNGNATVYLYDNLNRKVTETVGPTVDTATLNNATILGPRVVPTPTAATINNPGVIPAAEIDAQLAEAKARLNAVAGLFPPLADRVDDHPPTTTVWGYSPNDLVLIHQDQNGSETFTKYDAISRPVAVRIFRAGQHDSFAGDPVFAPAPVNPIPTNPSLDDEPTPTVVVGTNEQNFQYDGLARMTLATDNNDPTTTTDDSTVTDAYDSLSRVIEEGQTIGGMPTKVISSAWRADALLSKLTYPNGRAEAYTYDHLDRLKSVGDQGAAQPIAAYNYIGVDRVLERLYPQNGTRETFLDNSGTVDIGYDGLGRPTDLRNLRADNSVIVGFTYVYDRINNKLNEVKLHDSVNSESYSYDSASRLVGFQRAAGGIAPKQSTWKLDGVGNWTQVDNQTRQHSSVNEITQEKTGSTTTTIRSDDNGNQTDDGTYLYSYDAMNRLSTVTRKSDNALIAVYSYDAIGRRVQKVVSNSGALNGTTGYYLDGAQEIEERNGTDDVTRQYVYGATLDEPLVMDRIVGSGVQRLFYNQNALGSVFALTDITGQVLEEYQYDAYGLQTVFAGGVVLQGGASLLGNPYLFTGRRLDPETGLFYYRARYYNTEQGRFISRDPLSYYNGMNLYEYAGDNPTNTTDPTGELWGAVFFAAFQAYDTYLLWTGQIKGPEYALRTAVNTAALVLGPGARIAYAAATAAKGARAAAAVTRAVNLAKAERAAVNSLIALARPGGSSVLRVGNDVAVRSSANAFQKLGAQVINQGGIASVGPRQTLVLVAHGTGKKVAGMLPKELAAFLRANGFRGGAVLLQGCKAGKSFAKPLANLLRVPVKATPLLASKPGAAFVRGTATGLIRRAVSVPGTWKWFFPPIFRPDVWNWFVLGSGVIYRIRYDIVPKLLVVGQAAAELPGGEPGCNCPPEGGGGGGGEPPTVAQTPPPTIDTNEGSYSMWNGIEGS
jgi:RHS repeat-associated protein